MLGGRRDPACSSLVNAGGSRNLEIWNCVAATEAALGRPAPRPGAPGPWSAGDLLWLHLFGVCTVPVIAGVQRPATAPQRTHKRHGEGQEQTQRK